MRLKGTLGMLALGAVAAVAALEGWQQSRQRDATVAQPAARAVPPPTLAGDAPLPLADRLRREWLSGEAIGEPFGARKAPGPGAHEASRPLVAAAAPVSAPFPYLYAGQLSVKDGKRHVYLMKGNDLVPINVGDVLDGVFKVTAIAAAEFEVVHLPSATARVIQYASLGTGSTLAQGEPAPLPTHAGAAVSSTPGSLAARRRRSRGPQQGPAPEAPRSSALPVFAGTSPASPAPPSTSSSESVRIGSVPTGQLGSSGPAAGAPRLGVAPSASGSMPVSPAPSGIMQTLPAPTGRLGV